MATRHPLTIGITGSTGLLGNALAQHLSGQGHRVIPILRNRNFAGDHVKWNPLTGEISLCLNGQLDAIIHLAGENLAAGRWTSQRKQQLIESRVAATHRLAQSIAQLAQPPAHFISASAIGYYGNTHDRLITETDPCGTGFLAELCRDWEHALQPLLSQSIETSILRTGVVLSRDGGALKKLLPLFRYGLGGQLGSGKQYFSWISIEDWIAAVDFVLQAPGKIPVANLTAPEPVTNREFTHTLASVLHRKAIFPVPAFALKLAVGEMAEEALLAGQRVLPQALQQAGFQFKHTNLRNALQSILIA